MTVEQCHCGLPLHYRDEAVERLVRQIIEALGPTVEVVISGRRWRVPRHYIALHGLKGSEVHRLGFEEAT